MPRNCSYQRLRPKQSSLHIGKKKRYWQTLCLFRNNCHISRVLIGWSTKRTSRHVMLQWVSLKIFVLLFVHRRLRNPSVTIQISDMKWKCLLSSPNLPDIQKWTRKKVKGKRTWAHCDEFMNIPFLCAAFKWCAVKCFKAWRAWFSSSVGPNVQKSNRFFKKTRLVSELSWSWNC